MPPKSASVGGSNPEFILREFEGMNVLDSREAINDNEFYWCENMMPVAPGALYPVNGPSAALVTCPLESGAPSYTMNFNVTGTDYCFAVWLNSGNGYVVNLSTFLATKIVTGLVSGQTAAVQWSNQGLLIIDPTGYWDWNVTTPGVLTPQNNAVSYTTLLSALRVAGGSSLHQTISSSSGSGATFQTFYQVVQVTLNAPGTGYAVGDTLSLTDGSPTAAAQIVVASISGGGATGPITGITLSTGGTYPGPTSSTPIAVGPTGNTVTTTGSGTGATFTTHIAAVSCSILTRGTGYSSGYVFDFNGAVGITNFSFFSSGVIGGTAIATYVGRVWIASVRTVYVTDVGSYVSFGGAGFSFTITEDYLHNAITALAVANSYLYIFGDTSIDAVSNVTVVGGVSSFSRINLTASIGTSTPTSVFPYYRALVFYHASGFYLLSGATPEKISEKISGIVRNITTPSGVAGLPFVYGAQVLLYAELCAAFVFTFIDSFTQNYVPRSLIALFFRGRWWVASLPGLAAQAAFSIPAAGVATLYSWAGNVLYRAFSAPQPLAAWLIKTKLWDANAPLREKQSLNAAVAANVNVTNAMTVTVDTETGSSSAYAVTLAPQQSGGYALAVQAASEDAPQGDSQYLGMTLAGSINVAQIRMLGLRAKADRNIFQ